MWEDCSAVGQCCVWVLLLLLHTANGSRHSKTTPLALAKSHLKSLLAGGAGEGGNDDLDRSLCLLWKDS